MPDGPNHGTLICADLIRKGDACMKSYELSIETKQPTCGGKSPTKVELLEVKLDDPLAFVRSREADLPLLTEQSPDGDLVVRVETEKHQVTYTFTEL